MVELATLQAASYIMGSLGVFVAAVYYILNIQNNKKNQEMQLETRQFQLLMQMSEVPNSYEGNLQWTEFLNMEWSDYDDFEKKYGSDNNPENYALRTTMLGWFNKMGLLIKYEKIDPELVYDFNGPMAIWAWNKFKDITLKQRELYNPTSQLSFEYLFNEMKRIHENRGYSAESSMTPLKYTPELRERAISS
ncbi:MAG: hypothetical protein ABIJ47_05025 [Candidatus Bathyarchaeota archaeon]